MSRGRPTVIPWNHETYPSDIIKLWIAPLSYIKQSSMPFTEIQSRRNRLLYRKMVYRAKQGLCVNTDWV